MKEQTQSCIIGSWFYEVIRKSVSLQQPLEKNGSLSVLSQHHQVNQCLQLFLFTGLLLNQSFPLYILYILVSKFALH